MESQSNVDNSADLTTTEATGNNSDEQSNSDSNQEQETDNIGIYCTLRSRPLAPTRQTSLREEEAQHDEWKYPLKDSLTAYCTVGKRLRNFIKANTVEKDLPYSKLEETLSTSSTNFGISKDLSTESIRNACEVYELSDDEGGDSAARRSIEAINGSLLDRVASSNFKRSLMRASARTSSIDRKHRLESFHPYCTIRRDRNDRYPDKTQVPYTSTLERLHPDSIEAYHILNELDAILDNQDAIEFGSISSATPEKVEDYLLELDTYLEQIDQYSRIGSEDPQRLQVETQLENSTTSDSSRDARSVEKERSQTLPKRLRKLIDAKGSEAKQPATHADASPIQRGGKLRSTIGSSQPGVGNDRVRLFCENPNSRRQKTWRRNSMRKTALIHLGDEKSEARASESPLSSPKLSERLHPDHVASRSASQPDNLDMLTHATASHSKTSQSAAPVQSTTNSPASMDCVQSECTRIQAEDFPAFNSVNFPPTGTTAALWNLLESSHELRRCASDVPVRTAERDHSLTHIDIINDILQSTSSCDTTSHQHRPRQIGRRAEAHPRVVSIMAEMGDAANPAPRIVVNHDRPMSAPAGHARIVSSANESPPPMHAQNHRYVSSEPSSIGSSRNPSPVSLLSSTASSSLASTHAVPPSSNAQQGTALNDDPHTTDCTDTNINSQWPHGFSRTLALLCCTLGLFNISRFSVLTIHYGGNFLLQFLLLSIVFGIPMFWLQMCLGAKIKSGPVSMWKISPICKGIGIALTLAQGVVALYSVITLAWCLIYFRDSFISRNDRYRWQDPYYLFRRPSNITSNLTETVADYFNGMVLQRLQPNEERKDQAGGVRFQIAFNVAVIWIAIFLFLCKGLKSFGKVVLGLTLLPLVIFVVICCKFLYIVDFSTVQHIFSTNDFEDFLVNSKSWTAAAQETFLTWGLLGPSVVAISAKSAEKSEGKTILRRDAIIVVLLTLFGLSIAAIFGYACIQILQNNNYIYLPGSFEYPDTYTFLYSLQVPVPQDRIGVPAKWAPHHSSVIGECYRRTTTAPLRESGFQALRLITELFPATVAVATQEYVSPVWTLLTYLMFLVFGLGQMCAMWKPISSLLGNTTSSVLLSCVVGLLLGIPFATEMGMTIIHYLDYVVGGSWFLLILWTAQIFGVFLIRGRPYNGDLLVNDLKMASSMSAFLALSWNVLLPIGLVALAIIEYKVTLSSQLFHWRGRAYFPLWSRKVGGLIQIGFLLIVPLTALVQIYRYLSRGPPDLFDRIQLLYRPSMASAQDRRRNRPNIERLTTQQQTTLGLNATSVEAQQIQDDAPPKYTPPPSYTTATGARLAKLLRQSIRRSVRRILGEPSRNRPSIATTTHGTASAMPSPPLDSSLPPEYSTVLTDPSGDECSPAQLNICPRMLYNSHTNRSLSLERPSQRSREYTNESISRGTRRNNQTFTAIDVAQILRSSSHHHPRHERSASAITAMDNLLKTSSLRHGKKTTSRSVENLVLNAAPLGESNAIARSPNSLGDSESTSVI